MRSIPGNAVHLVCDLDWREIAKALTDNDLYREVGLSPGTIRLTRSAFMRIYVDQLQSCQTECSWIAIAALLAMIVRRRTLQAGPNGLSGATPGQHVELSKHRMSLTARCADQLTQSQTRWSVRCIPFHAIRRSFTRSLVRFFPLIRQPKPMWKCSVPPSILDLQHRALELSRLAQSLGHRITPSPD